jgi:predicted permease
LLLSSWLTQILANLTNALPVPVALDLAPDSRVLIFALGITLISGLLSGLVPALHASRTDLVSALKQDVGAQGFRRQRLRAGLLVGQVALSCVLFLAAMLFARSLQEAGRIDQGFDASNVDVAALDFAMGGYRGADAVRFGDQFLQRTRQLPGVEAAALTRMIPLSGGGMGLGLLAKVGHDPEKENLDADWDVITPGYFRTLKIPIVAGRDFTAADRQGAPSVAIVNETFAARVWPGESAVGQRLVRETPEGRSELTVVGVVRNGKYRFLGEAPLAYIYVPHAQEPMLDMKLVVKSAGRTSALPALRSALHELDPNLPIIKAQSLAEAVSVALLPQRVASRLAGSLGMLGLLLAAFGIYGVTAFAVAQRTREIGVRMALGAPQGQVLKLILKQGLGLTVLGVAIGLVAGALAARLMSSLLFGLGADDPLTFATVAVVFVGIAGLASYLPGRTAMKIDPLKALRVD